MGKKVQDHANCRISAHIQFTELRSISIQISRTVKSHKNITVNSSSFFQSLPVKVICENANKNL